MNFAHLIFTGPRGVGKTTHLARVAKELNGTLVCINAEDARRVKEEHEVGTISAFINEEHLMGRKIGPLIFDTDAVAAIISQYEIVLANKIATIREQAERLNHELYIS